VIDFAHHCKYIKKCKRYSFYSTERDKLQVPFNDNPAGVSGVAATISGGANVPVEKGDGSRGPHDRQDGDSVVPRGGPEPEVRVDNEAQSLYAVC
jgi:hypothetical protein